jgi:hypothetical protein
MSGFEAEDCVRAQPISHKQYAQPEILISNRSRVKIVSPALTEYTVARTVCCLHQPSNYSEN